MKRTIVVGDIHGCFDELNDLLDRLAPTTNDRIISTGDLIVKGRRNREVLDLFIDDSRFSSVVGNHDRAVLRFWTEGRRLSPEQERCRLELEPERARYQSYLQSLRPFVEIDKAVVVHAGLRPDVKMKDQSLKEMTTMRTLGTSDSSSRDGVPWYEIYDGKRFVLFGHWAAGDVRRGARALGIDTACVYGNRLTAYILETGEITSVPARATYSDYGRPLPKP